MIPLNDPLPPFFFNPLVPIPPQPFNVYIQNGRKIKRQLEPSYSNTIWIKPYRNEQRDSYLSAVQKDLR